MPKQLAEPVLSWAIVERGVIRPDDVSDFYDDLVERLNRPRGQRVARVKITELPMPRQRKR